MFNPPLRVRPFLARESSPNNWFLLHSYTHSASTILGKAQARMFESQDASKLFATAHAQRADLTDSHSLKMYSSFLVMAIRRGEQ